MNIARAAITWHRELPSTNSAALDRIAAGNVAPAWIAAERQTAGRGRSGRAWSDCDGNLAATLVWPLDGLPEARPQLAFVAGVALASAVMAYAPPVAGARGNAMVELKWPNDLLIGRAKCAGILVESTHHAAGMAAAIGFGVNLRHAPALTGRATTSLAALGFAVSPQEFLGTLSHHMADWLSVWDGGHGFETVRSAWMARSVPLGTGLEVHDGALKVAGRYFGIDTDGALRLEVADGTVRRLIAGDVDLAEPTGAASPVTGKSE